MSTTTQDFDQLLVEVKALLQAEQRLSYRGLKRRFNLDDDDIEDIKDELIYAQKLASDEAGKVLVWGADASATPGHHAPRQLAQGAPLQGEKKQVTILFCDIVESMPLTEKLGLEGWHDAINEFFDILSKTIGDLEGTTCKFTGDGVMALFGAPIAAEDHALRACMAALNIRRDIADWNRGIKKAYDAEFQIRIGVNTGEAVVGNIGDPGNNEYTANGNAVGIAARLESKAQINQILISESCAHEVRGLCGLTPIGAHEIKGVSRPIELYILKSVETGANRFDVARHKGLTRFVGRSDDLAALNRALDRAHSGCGQIVGIEAEAGTGKSRLSYEFLESCRTSGMTVLEGHAVSHGRNIPYLPMLQVFRSYYGITPRDNPAEARESICERLLGMSPDFQEMLPLVYELLGVSDPNAPAVKMDPDAKQRQLFSLLRQIIGGADPTMGNIVTCIEDLHWFDPASAAFLDQWAEAMADSNSLLIVSFRPGFQAEWMSKPYYQQLSLKPLPAENIHELLVDLMGDDPSTAGLADEIFQRTGGNPFFCEEIVQSLVESGDLTQLAVSYRLNRSIRDLSIPASVHSVLAARIDRLHSNEKAVLQTAAVIGREFSLALLQHASEISDASLARSLARLIQNDFIHPHNLEGEQGYIFKHALTQEVAQYSQLQHKRQEVHARVAQGVEKLHADKADEVAALAAYHWEQAKQHIPAAAAYCRAAVHAGKGNRLQAMEYIRKALKLTDEEPASEARHQIRLQALAEMIAGGAWRFEMSDEELEARAQEARALAEGAGLTDLAALLRSGHSAALGMMRGDVKRWGTAIDEIVNNVEGISPEIEAALIANQGYSRYALGDLKTALQQAQRAVDMTGGDASFGLASGYSVLVTSYNEIALSSAAQGQFSTAIETNRKGQALAMDNGLTEELIWHQANQSEVLLPTGYPAEHPLIVEAASNAVKAHELAEQSASDYTRGVAKRCLAISLLLTQQYPEAEAALEDCLTHFRQRRAHLEVEAHCIELLALTQLKLNKTAEALSTAQQALAHSQAQGTVYFECLAHIAVARCLLAADPTGNAESIRAALVSAQALVESTGGDSQRPVIIELRGRLADALGESSLAATELEAALAGYRAIEAEGHMTRLEAELATAPA